MKEKHFANPDCDERCSILGEVSDKLIIESTFKIEIPEVVFYIINELGDVDCICLDQSGAVYQLTHGPYRVEMIYKNKEDYFKTL